MVLVGAIRILVSAPNRAAVVLYKNCEVAYSSHSNRGTNRVDATLYDCRFKTGTDFHDYPIKGPCTE